MTLGRLLSLSLSFLSCKMGFPAEKHSSRYCCLPSICFFFPSCLALCGSEGKGITSKTPGSCSFLSTSESELSCQALHFSHNVLGSLQFLDTKWKKKKKSHTNRRIICFSWVLELLDKIKKKCRRIFLLLLLWMAIFHLEFSDLSPDFLPNGAISLTDAQMEPILLDKTKHLGEAVRQEEIFLSCCRDWPV